MVVYRSMHNGRTWVRPLSSFMEVVAHPQSGDEVARFGRVNSSDTGELDTMLDAVRSEVESKEPEADDTNDVPSESESFWTYVVYVVMCSSFCELLTRNGFSVWSAVLCSMTTCLLCLGMAYNAIWNKK